MYTNENYLWGLVAYGVGFLLMMPLLYKLSRAVLPWRFLRQLFWVLVIAALLTPVRAYTDMAFLAPAWMVALFEFIRPMSQEGPARAVTPIVMAGGGLLLLMLFLYFLAAFIRQKKLVKPEETGAEH